MSLGEDHILCVAWLNLMSSLHMQLLIIVIDICVVKINFKFQRHHTPKRTLTCEYCLDVEHAGINQVCSTLISHLFVCLLQLQIIGKQKVFACKIMASSYLFKLQFYFILIVVYLLDNC